MGWRITRSTQRWGEPIDEIQITDPIGFITETEIKSKGIQLLAKYLGDVEAERFIALIQSEPFDDTKWRKKMGEDLSIKEISQKAMSQRNKNTQQ